MARRIVIKRRKRPEVLRMPATKFPNPSFGAGEDALAPRFLCLWCFHAKKRATDKCSECGHFGSTKTEQKKISQVYVEENPIRIEEM